MRITENVDFGEGRSVTVRELTVGEVRAWLAGLATAAAQPVDLVSDALFEGVSLADLGLFAEGEVNAEDLTQSEVRAVFDVARRLNPDFFQLRGRLLLASAPAIAPSPA